MSEATCRRNFMEICSAYKCVILPLKSVSVVQKLFLAKHDHNICQYIDMQVVQLDECLQSHLLIA